MLSLEHIRQVISENKNELTQQYKLKEIGVFGSFARSEQNQTSDVDILVDFNDTPGFFKFIELENTLSKLLGIKVDLVTKSSLKPYIGKQILSEVIIL